jgi:hypothetical protein
MAYVAACPGAKDLEDLLLGRLPPGSRSGSWSGTWQAVPAARASCPA